MTEREEHHDAYWTHDVALGEGMSAGERSTIRARVHVAEESYRGRDELLPQSQTSVQRLYLQAKPYILEPHITLAVELDPVPAADRAGRVVSADWKGLRHQEIGGAQAWIYPAERTAVIWEVLLLDRFRQDDPRGDPTLTSPRREADCYTAILWL